VSQPPYVTLWHNDRQVVRERGLALRAALESSPAALLFEGVRVVRAPRGVAIFRLSDHLARLYDAAERLGLELPFSPGRLAEACRSVVRVNALGDAYLQIAVRHDFGRGAPDVTIAAFDRGGIRPGAGRHLRDRAGETLFVARGRTLFAAPVPAVVPPGVMRDTVTALARRAGMDVRPAEWPVDAPAAGDEAFTADALEGLVPAGPRRPVGALSALQRAFDGLFNGATSDEDRWLETVELWPVPRYAEPVA
jgi:branched-subunit amino acid aminotransferase/4-amino-4-deoxychorismate lyase